MLYRIVLALGLERRELIYHLFADVVTLRDEILIHFEGISRRAPQLVPLFVFDDFRGDTFFLVCIIPILALYPGSVFFLSIIQRLLTLSPLHGATLRADIFIFVGVFKQLLVGWVFGNAFLLVPG